MTGIAVGQMGLSLETFLGLTLQQFDEACERFMERIEADDTMADRRLRKAVFNLLCPPKGKFTIFDLWEIEGDKELKALVKKQQQKKQKPSTKARFEELKEKWK